MWEARPPPQSFPRVPTVEGWLLRGAEREQLTSGTDSARVREVVRKVEKGSVV